MRLRRYLVRGVLALVLVAAGFLGWTSVKLWLAWRGVDRVGFDLEVSRGSLYATGSSVPSAAAGIPGDAFDAYLLAGSDGLPELDAERADVILLFLRPTDGANPLLISIPRDLYVRNPCSGEFSRINSSLDGCAAVANGAELLALTVEEVTGIAVDHFALFGFDGFIEVIDSVGGVAICVEFAFRQYSESPTLLEPGCTQADGVTALEWIKARTPQELIDGEWRASEDSGDRERNRRQRRLLLALLGELKQFRSPSAVTGLVEELSDVFVVDEGLGVSDAISLAMDLRNQDPSEILQPDLEVRSEVTESGEFVLVLDRPFAETLAQAYPALELSG